MSRHAFLLAYSANMGNIKDEANNNSFSPFLKILDQTFQKHFMDLKYLNFCGLFGKILFWLYARYAVQCESGDIRVLKVVKNQYGW